MNKTLKKITLLSICYLGFMSLSSCQAASAEIHDHKLNVESRMSNSVFLNPLFIGPKTVFIQIRNTSTTKIDGFKNAIEDHFNNIGYTVVGDPQKAFYIVQVNILQFGQVKSKEQLWKDGMNFNQSAMTGLAAGVGTSMMGASGGAGLATGVAVTGASWLANEMIENKIYSVITDVQISEEQNSKIMKRYNTRIISEANKVNLEFRDAKPILIKQLSKEISGIFASN
jgi:hypothetical protein